MPIRCRLQHRLWKVVRPRVWWIEGRAVHNRTRWWLAMPEGMGSNRSCWRHLRIPRRHDQFASSPTKYQLTSSLSSPCVIQPLIEPRVVSRLQVTPDGLSVAARFEDGPDGDSNWQPNGKRQASDDSFESSTIVALSQSGCG